MTYTARRRLWSTIPLDWCKWTQIHLGPLCRHTWWWAPSTYGVGGFRDSIYERVPAVPSWSKWVIVTTCRGPSGFIFTLVLGRRDIYSQMSGTGFPSRPIRFDLPPEAGVLFPKCFHFVCVSFLVFCKLLLHSGLGFQNARYFWWGTGVPNFSCWGHGWNFYYSASRGYHLFFGVAV